MYGFHFSFTHRPKPFHSNIEQSTLHDNRDRSGRWESFANGRMNLNKPAIKLHDLLVIQQLASEFAYIWLNGYFTLYHRQ